MAQDYQLVYRELSQLKKEVHLFHGAKTQHSSPALLEPNFSYMAGMGAIFTLNYAQPLTYWLKQQSNLSLPQDNYVAQISPERAKQDFDKIRTQAKELSHQAYSLERKIKSMQRSIQALEVTKQVAMQNLVEEAQQQLLSLKSQKSTLKLQYEQSKQRLSNISESTSGGEPKHYFRFFEKKISHQLCHLPDIDFSLPIKESLTFILKQTGPLIDGRYQDTNYNFKMENVRACYDQKINPQALIQGASKHYF